jgi:hypothetical protein
MTDKLQIKPQNGFQWNYLKNPAQIRIAGGAAGCSKTFSSLLDTLRFAGYKGHAPIFFRRELTDVKMPGGLWDEATQLYNSIFGRTVTENKSAFKLSVKNGATLRFGSIPHRNDLFQFAGMQSGAIYFDELTTFTEEMFWFMLSRNRHPVKLPFSPYVSATCNPDPDSFVARLIEWYIGQDGFPIPERANKVRFMLRKDGDILFYDTFQECYNRNKVYINEHCKISKLQPQDIINTFSFIPGKITDNKILLSNDPAYYGKLLALDEEQKARYLDGNWKIKIDDKALCNYERINDLENNFAETGGKKYITCDASRYGKDYTVIFVWDGWTVIEMHSIKQTGTIDIYDAIEKLRAKHLIPTSRVVIDADGVGNEAAKIGKYQRFHGASKQRIDVKTMQKDDFKNFKTQCIYRMSQRINEGTVAIRITSDACTSDYDKGCRVIIKGRVYDFRELLRQDLRLWKRKDNMELKKQVIDKEQMKDVLGRAPDWGDTMFMREFFELNYTTM